MSTHRRDDLLEPDGTGCALCLVWILLVVIFLTSLFARAL